MCFTQGHKLTPVGIQPKLLNTVGRLKSQSTIFSHVNKELQLQAYICIKEYYREFMCLAQGPSPVPVVIEHQPLDQESGLTIQLHRPSLRPEYRPTGRLLQIHVYSEGSGSFRPITISAHDHFGP